MMKYMPCAGTTLLLLNKEYAFCFPIFTVGAWTVKFSVTFTLLLATHVTTSFGSSSLSPW